MQEWVQMCQVTVCLFRRWFLSSSPSSPPPTLVLNPISHLPLLCFPSHATVHIHVHYMCYNSDSTILMPLYNIASGTCR